MRNTRLPFFISLNTVQWTLEKISLKFRTIFDPFWYERRVEKLNWNLTCILPSPSALLPNKKKHLSALVNILQSYFFSKKFINDWYKVCCYFFFRNQNWNFDLLSESWLQYAPFNSKNSCSVSTKARQQEKNATVGHACDLNVSLVIFISCPIY